MLDFLLLAVIPAVVFLGMLYVIRMVAKQGPSELAIVRARMAVLAGARTEADFDGRPFSSLGRHDKFRYMRRYHESLIISQEILDMPLHKLRELPDYDPVLQMLKEEKEREHEQGQAQGDQQALGETVEAERSA